MKTMQESMGDGDCSVSVMAFASCLSRRRRKSNGRRSPAAAATCLSPSWIFSRWRNKSKEEKKRAPGKILNGKSPLDSGGQKKEPSFNLGVGLGLIYVIAGCRNELNKIVDLRLQFETLIQSYKVQNQANGKQLSTPSTVSALDNVPCFNSDRRENFKDSGDCSSEIITTCSCDRYTTCKNMTSSRNLGYLGSSEMDELEAELEAELGRLQLDLDAEVTFKQSKQQDNEIITANENGGSHNESFGGVVGVVNETTCGEHQHWVSPYELEIRLHELLEKRQQERIEELESALESAMKKLHKKDEELSWWKDIPALESAMKKLHKKDEELQWWKDTAKLISQHVPNTPRFLGRSATTK